MFKVSYRVRLKVHQGLHAFLRSKQPPPFFRRGHHRSLGVATNCAENATKRGLEHIGGEVKIL